VRGAPARRSWGAVLFVWGIWTALLFAMIQFVATYGTNIPYYDEWDMVPRLVGERRVTPKWLWSQHNEHRIVIGRLVYIAATRLTDYDFRAVMFVNIAILAACAAGLIHFMRRLRGYTDYTDAFFPLLMLHLGQAENLIWAFQITFVFGTGLAILILCLLATPGRLSFRSGMLLASCAVLCPLVGGNGLGLVPAVFLCVLVVAWESWQGSPKQRRQAVGILALGVVSVVVAALYFVRYTRPAKHPFNPNIDAMLQGALRIMGMGLGAATKLYWPQIKTPLAVALASTGLVLGAITFFARNGRVRALRLLLFAGALLSVALGIAWARTAVAWDAILVSRYATLAAPLWCTVYLVFQLCFNKSLRTFAHTLLFLTAGVLFVKNRELGIQEAVRLNNIRSALVQDVLAGKTVSEIVERHHKAMTYAGPEVFAERLRMLRKHGVGVFTQMHEAPQPLVEAQPPVP